MNKLPHTVFVYGTLKKKFPNHRVLHTGKAELVGHGTTVPKFLLVNGGFPKMANMPRVSSERLQKLTPKLGHVWGEVWRLDDESFMACDRLEGHPRFYCREKVGIKLDGSMRGGLTAWAYVITSLGSFDIDMLMTPKDGILTWDENTRERWPSDAWVKELDDNFNDFEVSLVGERKHKEAVLRGRILARERKR